MRRRNFLQSVGLMAGAVAVGGPVLSTEFAPLEPSKLPITDIPMKWEVPPLAWVRKYPRLMLLNRANFLVREAKADEGNWVIKNDDGSVTNLGEEITIVPLEFHPKAVHFQEDRPPLEYFSFGSPHFQRIMDLAEDDSLPYNERWRNQFGIEFFLGLPDSKQIVTFFCGTRTLKRFAHSMMRAGHLEEQRPVVIGRKKLKTGRFTWYAPTSHCHNPRYPFEPIDLKVVDHATANLGEREREVRVPVLRRALEGNFKGTREVRIEPRPKYDLV